MRADGRQDATPVVRGEPGAGQHLREGLALLRPHHSGSPGAALRQPGLHGLEADQEEAGHGQRLGEHQVHRLPHLHLPQPLQQHDGPL